MPDSQSASGRYIAQALGAGAKAYVIENATLQIGDLSREELHSLLLKAVTPRPEVTDLFEIIRNPADVPAAVFRTAPGRAIVPYEIPHIQAREGISDTQDDLYQKLLDSGGALLVQSRA